VLAINIDSKLLDALQASSCFGIAHDETVAECKQCDVRSQCAAKSKGTWEGVVPSGKVPAPSVKDVGATKKSTPAKKADKPKAPAKKATKPAETKAKKPTPEKKATAPVSDGSMPDFKPMSMDELKKLAKQRSVEWKEYGNPQITRMRLIMALKSSY
jgi:hypothetical protein